jgi:hypothetical protein
MAALRSASALVKAGHRFYSLDLAMLAIGMIVIFLAVLVGLNIFEHGRAD